MTSGNQIDSAFAGTTPDPKSRITAQRVAFGVMNRITSIENLSPQALKHAIDLFRSGYIREAMLLWYTMYCRDSVILGAASKRYGAVAELPWEIVAKDKSAAAMAHQKALQDFYANIEVKDVLEQDQTGGVELLIEQMATAIGMKYAVHEVVLRPGVRGQPFTALFNFCPPWWFEARSGKLRYLPADHDVYGVEMLRGEWLVTVSSVALMEATSWLYFRKEMSESDWDNFVERFGLPFILGKSQQGQGSQEWDGLLDLVQNYRGDGGGVVDINAQVEVQHPPAAGSGGSHEEHVRHKEEKINQLWRGGDLSTQSKGGGAVGSNLQQEESDILLARDARTINSAMRSQVDRMVIEYLFGNGVKPLAEFTLVTADETDVDRDLKVDEAFLKWGLSLAKSDLYKRYGRAQATSEDDEIEAPEAADPAAQSPNGKKPNPTQAAPADPEDADEIVESANELDQAIKSEVVMEKLAPVLAKVFAPLREELQAIADLPDGARGAALERFRGNLGGYLITHGISDPAVRIITSALGTEVLRGLQGTNPAAISDSQKTA